MNYKLVNFCEFDENAVKSYCAIHNEDEKKNLGDITKVNISSLPKCDLITHGSPCQDFSIAGDNKGGDEESGTRSSLLWNSVKIIEHCKPKFIIWENVKNVLSNKHKHNFDKYIDTLNSFGYTSIYHLTNAIDYDLPQNRERIFVVSIRNDIYKKFSFPINGEHPCLSMEKFIDKGIKRHVNKTLERFFDEKYKHDYGVSKNGLHKMFDGEKDGGFTSDFTNKRIYSIYGCSPTLTTCGNVNLWEEKGMMTEKEMFRLMGFTDEDFYKASSTGIAKMYLHKQAGNSICVKVPYYIFKELIKEYPEDTKDMRVISLFSGIGAFEKALELL